MRSIIKKIPIEINEQAIEIYELAKDNREEDSIAVERIQVLFKEKGLECSDKTVYRMITEWKKSGSIKSIIESFDVDLSSPYRRTEYILSVLEEELRKSVEKEEDIHKKIRIADSMHKYIETEIKIEVLRSKKTTTGHQEETSKIVEVTNV